MKRKSKFEDVPGTNSAIQILDKPAAVMVMSQPDEYIGFVPPEFQTQDYGHLQNYNSALYQPVQEKPSMTVSEHYQQIWSEYKSNVTSGPSYSSHSNYLQTQSYPPPPYNYPPPSYQPPPPNYTQNTPYPSYQPPPLNPNGPAQALPPPPPIPNTERRKKSRFSNA